MCLLTIAKWHIPALFCEFQRRQHIFTEVVIIRSLQDKTKLRSAKVNLGYEPRRVDISGGPVHLASLIACFTAFFSHAHRMSTQDAALLVIIPAITMTSDHIQFFCSLKTTGSKKYNREYNCELFLQRSKMLTLEGWTAACSYFV